MPHSEWLRILVSMTSHRMRAVPCLALLLAALLLQGTAADSKRDPSSTNCQGPVKESGSRPGSRSLQSQPYEDYDAGYVHEYDSYGAQAQQEGGLLGAKVWGELLFNSQTSYAGSPNYFDDREGYVPDGYGNCHPGGPWAIITDDAKPEFAYEGSSNKFTVDLDSSGMIVLTAVVHASGKNNPMVIVLKSSAFEGYEISLLHNHFKGAVITADISDGTITIKVPEVVGLIEGERLVAVWKLSVCTDSAEQPCCFNGQFKKQHNMCRPASGPCDRAEYCTGNMGECPLDVIERAGTVCREARSFCDAVDECDGYSKECPDWDEEDGTHCPWAKDCYGCTMNSTLRYSRTGPKPYTKGGYGGEYGAVPLNTWPECVGKCMGGACQMNPIAATCCREDEEAYPLEEEEEEEYYGEGEEEEGYEEDGDEDASTEGVKVSARRASALTKKRRTGRIMTRTMGGSTTDEGKDAKTTSDAKTKRSRKAYRHTFKGRRSSSKYGSSKYNKQGEDKEEEADSKYNSGAGSKYGSSKKRKDTSYSKDSSKDTYSKDSSKADKKYESKYNGGSSKKEEEQPKKEYKDKADTSKPENKDKADSSKPEYKESTPPSKPEHKDKSADSPPKDKPDSKPEYKESPPAKEQPEHKEEKEHKPTPPPAHKEVDYKPKEQFFTGNSPDKKSEARRKYSKETPSDDVYFGGKHDPKDDEDRGPSPDYFGGKKHSRPHPRREPHHDYYQRDGLEGRYKDEGPEDYYRGDGPEGYGYGEDSYESYGEQEESYEEDSSDMPISCWA